MKSTGDIDAAVRQLIEQMTLEEKVGQLFVVEVYGQDVDTADPVAVEGNQKLYFVNTPAQVIDKYKPGGVIYFSARGQNLDTPKQIATFSNGLQAAAMRQPKRIPLLISTDQEGGSAVSRLPGKAVAMPGNMALGATRSEADARRSAQVIGAQLAALGINQNYAPVADVNVNPANPIIGMRSVGADPKLVSDLVAAQVKGYHDGGVSAVAKHFPGHGNTNEDSHIGLPEIPHDSKQLHDIDLKPFQAAIGAGIEGIMTGHLVVRSIDPSGVPATMSRPILTGLLRGELGYDGLIVTDGLDMKGASSTFPTCVAPLEALKAGADQLLLAPQMDVAYNAVRYAVIEKKIPMSRLNESVYRILRLKMKRGLFDNPYVDADAAETIVSDPAYDVDARAIAERATTVVRNDAYLLPLSRESRKVLVTGFGGAMKATDRIGEELGAREQTFTVRDTGKQPTAAEIGLTVAQAELNDLVVVVTGNASEVVTATGHPSDSAAAQQALVIALLATGKPIVIAAMRNPYDVSRLPYVPTYVATYGSTPASARSLVRVLFGEIKSVGRLPVTILTADGSAVVYPFGHGLSLV